MRNALTLFNENINSARHAGALYDYLILSVTVPASFEDLLRSQVVYAVSAFDKLIHDLVRIGMIEIFTGLRPPTPKYLAEPISIQIHSDLISASIPPKEHIFEQAIFRKLKIVSYQDPAKVADGLSYIWDEGQKWQKISEKMTQPDNVVRTTLKLIADRRNTIVHEADIDPITNEKLSITKVECEELTSFLHRCGNEIAKLVTR
ncbi:MAG: HEPN domain-containing protein [Pseudomonas sp.]|uniref:HEPN domain-containing protein n=1 Tax=Pseudomonas sp. TaxID=306 RepID=UPI0027349646|nr:HEPN domain-containing protein [Pseudomonas sp.]MDP3848268.1 HEPN domain-containing protein [Pseudomonas sp.]